MRCTAALPTPTQLRVVPRSALASPRFAAALRVTRGAGRRAPKHQGYAPPPVVVVVAAAGLSGDGHWNWHEPHARAREAPPGWFKAEKVEKAVLKSLVRGSDKRFDLDAAVQAADWLEARLAPASASQSGQPNPAAQAFKSHPLILAKGVAELQRTWDALTLPEERGGAGLAFSEEQARAVVGMHPQVLCFHAGELRYGWASMTSTKAGGLGMSPAEARHHFRCNPLILMLMVHHEPMFTRTVELLKNFGFPDARDMVLAHPILLHYSLDAMEKVLDWWILTGLDYVKIIQAQPELLGRSTQRLATKLDLLRKAGASDADLNAAMFFDE